MAVEVSLERDGFIKSGYVGFSWTTLFFGCFVAIFRKDYITALFMFILGVVLGYLLEEVAAIYHLLLAFAYNKYYTKNLVEKEGFVPVNEQDEELLKQYGIFIKY